MGISQQYEMKFTAHAGEHIREQTHGADVGGGCKQVSYKECSMSTKSCTIIKYPVEQRLYHTGTG